MTSVSVSHNLKDVEKWLTQVEKKKLPSIVSQSLNESGRGVRTDLASLISDDTGIKKGQLSQKSGGVAVVRKASPRSPLVVIEATRKTTDFDKFKNKPRHLKSKRAVRVTVKGKRKLIRKAVVIDGKVKAKGLHSGSKFKFDGRRKYKTLRGLSPASQFEQPYIKNSLDSIVGKRFNKSFERIARRKLGL